MGVRSRLVTTLLLVLIVLGGAGLAVAADREQTSFQRPELTWAADHAAQAYIAPLTADLTPVGADASDLAKAGRDTLGNLQALKLDAVRAALSDGDAAAAQIAAALPGLAADHDTAQANIQTWRLGPETGAQVDAIDAAVVSAPTLQQAWTSIETRASAVAALVADLQSHDSDVFQATTAARQENWTDALASLGMATAALSSAQSQGRDLGQTSGSDTL